MNYEAEYGRRMLALCDKEGRTPNNRIGKTANLGYGRPDPKIRQLVLDALRSGPALMTDVAKNIGVTVGKLRFVMGAMRREGELVMDRGPNISQAGIWSLNPSRKLASQGGASPKTKGDPLIAGANPAKGASAPICQHEPVACPAAGSQGGV